MTETNAVIVNQLVSKITHLRTFSKKKKPELKKKHTTVKF